MKTQNQSRLLSAASLALSIAIVAGATAAFSGPGEASGAYNAYVAETAAAEITKAAAPQYLEKTASINAADGIDADEGISSGALGAVQPLQPLQTARKLIRTVNLSLETTEFDALLDTLTRVVNEAGGYMEQSDISGSSISSSPGKRRYAYITARIPSDKLDSFVAEVGSHGNITEKSESTEDVTLNYADIESRKKTLNVEQERLWDLLAKADSIESVIALETRLSEIRYQLESMESQLRTYDNQVDYSTVHFNINEVQVFTPTQPDSVFVRIQKGFRRSITDIRDAAVNVFVWFFSNLPALAVFAVITGILFVVIKIILKRLVKFFKRPVKDKEKDED